MLTYFEKILQLCEEHNRKVVLLSMPLSKEYLNEFSKKIIDIEEYVSVELTIEKYPCVVYDLAYQTEYIEKAEYFSSTDHLNLSGRNQLSELILKELQGLEE